MSLLSGTHHCSNKLGLTREGAGGGTRHGARLVCLFRHPSVDSRRSSQRLGDPLWLDKHAVASRAVKVPVAFDQAIVDPGRLIKLHADSQGLNEAQGMNVKAAENASINLSRQQDSPHGPHCAGDKNRRQKDPPRSSSHNASLFGA